MKKFYLALALLQSIACLGNTEPLLDNTSPVPGDRTVRIDLATTSTPSPDGSQWFVLNAPGGIFLNGPSPISVTVSAGGTNYTYQATNNSFGNVVVLSNALFTATNIAGMGIANGTDSNVVVTVGPGIWLTDIFNNGTTFGYWATVQPCVSVRGSGNTTVLMFTNNGVFNDLQVPFFCQGEFGGFAMNFWVSGRGPSSESGNNTYYHDLYSPWPLWNPANGITNGCIDGVWNTFSGQTNRAFDNLHINGTYDAVNVGIGDVLAKKTVLQFNNCDFTEQTYTNSSSLIVRDATLYCLRSNLTVTFNGCNFNAIESVTNSPYITPGANTNDASCIEIGAGSKGLSVYVLNSKFNVASNNNTGWPINFGGVAGANASGTNFVYLDAYSSSSLNTNQINWGPSSRSNCVIFLTPPGWTNYLQDAVWIHNP